MWVIILVAILSFLVRYRPAIFSRLVYHHTVYRVNAARDTINFRRFNIRTLGERLLLRALPNRRLTAAFGINNAFTTTDPRVYKNFIPYATHVINRVNADNEEWRQLTSLGQDTLWRHLSDLGHKPWDQHQQLHLASTVRILCFVVILHFLFPGAQNIDLQAARDVTEDINRHWVQSKNALDPVSKREQDRLVARIRQMLPTTEKGHSYTNFEEQTNPLEIILPAYETLWRVVLLTYVHLAFRGISSDGPRVKTESLAREILAGLTTHLGTGTEEESTILMISKEALRLYPPTKRIHRATPSALHTASSTPKPIIVAADIESLHRDSFIWGHNAHDFFLPRMSQGLTQHQKDAYMPFGLAPHLCPASNKFGERMVAMLIGTLFHGLGTSGTGTTIEYGDGQLDGDRHASLPTGREDAEGWHIFL
ncbi:hypothetical protein PG989_000368 [Apiospora arundinis]|uniref:Cytochrome P450 n=1 Tax=Apiospora arundinis TaxID=335852 RepID=A0ABR2IY50_9PEZI